MFDVSRWPRLQILRLFIRVRDVHWVFFYFYVFHICALAVVTRFCSGTIDWVSDPSIRAQHFNVVHN